MLLLRSCHLSSSWASMAPDAACPASMASAYTDIHNMERAPACFKLASGMAWHA